jgi:plastocyanin
MIIHLKFVTQHTIRRIVTSLIAALLLAQGITSMAATVEVQVGRGLYTPYEVTIRPGDTVRWVWRSDVQKEVSVTSGMSGRPNGLFDSGLRRALYTFSYTFNDPGRFDYFCRVCPEMEGIVLVIGSQPLNISTRLRVQTGENVMIGGFIITGQAPKKVIVRAIGPSLQQAGVNDALADPVVEVRAGNGALIRSNDNWRDDQQAEIEATGIPPRDNLESAIVATLAPGNYTAIVSGKNGTAGVGLVEVYDLDAGADARLVNLSTRGFVQTGSDVMIGGFILGNSNESARIVLRAIGPSLAQVGISGALADPTLQLVNGNGDAVAFNNNWRDTQQAELQATTIPPRDDREAAIVATLAPGAYTAVVRGSDGTTGVGYHLQ